MSLRVEMLATEEMGRWRRYPRYKDSGVAWIGEIPAHWSIMQLKRVFKVLNGSTPKSSEPSYWHGDILWVTPEDLGSLTGREITATSRMITEAGYQSCGTHLAPSGSLVLSTRAPIGHLAMAGKPLCTNQGCRTLMHLHDSSSRSFFFYLLSVATPELQSWGQGSTFMELAASKLEEFHVAVPPVAEQHLIAGFLDHKIGKIDALIQKKERLVALLLEKRAALISRAVTKGLDASAPMKASGVSWIGEIPAHWKMKRVRDIAESLQTGPFGSQLHYDDYCAGGIPVINPAHIKNGSIEPDGECAVDQETWSRLARHALREGDIIFARRGEMGRCALVTTREAGWLCGTGSLRIRPNKNICNASFLSRVLSTRRVRDWLLLESVGSTMENLNTKILSNIPLPFPDLFEQDVIVASLEREVGKIDALIARVREGIEKLKEYSTALIAAAVTGKIDVREKP